MKTKDLTFQRFGMLVAVRYAGKDANGKTRWVCRCDCGVVKPTVHSSNLTGGRSTSCGCQTLAGSVRANTRHGHGRNRRTGRLHTPTYNNWRAMRARCENPKDKAYPFYGGRGITVCERWRSFSAFLADMGERPFQDAEVDRIDNSLGYEPGNCRWVTHKQNGRNTRTNRVIDTPQGPMLVCEALEVSGLNIGTLSGRLRRGWPASKLFDPPRKLNKRSSS